MELSFVPWHLLSMATFGLTDLFYASAYITATRCEFYAAVLVFLPCYKIPLKISTCQAAPTL